MLVAMHFRIDSLANLHVVVDGKGSVNEGRNGERGTTGAVFEVRVLGREVGQHEVSLRSSHRQRGKVDLGARRGVMQRERAHRARQRIEREEAVVRRVRGRSIERGKGEGREREQDHGEGDIVRDDGDDKGDDGVQKQDGDGALARELARGLQRHGGGGLLEDHGGGDGAGGGGGAAAVRARAGGRGRGGWGCTL
ncbi:hypothetical protein FGB62_470g04 [Gracilaria domingensis]|nr:hypothetical protein FGB62_470g04 [Gracilaria domingensis]